MNEAQRQRAEGNQLTLWEVMQLLLEKLHLLAMAGIGAGLAMFLILALFVTPTYESSVSFYVYNSFNNANQSGTINNSDLQAAESLATTYSKILESNSVLDAVLEGLGSEDLSRKELSEMIDVSVISDTQLLEVVVTTTDAERSCRIAESFARVAPTEIVRITKAGGVEVVDQPEVATEKASPRTLFDTVIGAIVGVLVMVVILLLRAVSDTTLYLPEDVDKLAGAIVLGQIPEIDVPEGKYNNWSVVKGGVVRLADKK